MKEKVQIIPENLICFSHLRWDFVFQRPQHLLSRFTEVSRVWFFEEPIFDAKDHNFLQVRNENKRLKIVVPHLISGMDDKQIDQAQGLLLKKLLRDIDLEECIFWYYTPMALKFSENFKPKMILYDCMDELSAFKFAPKELVLLEKKLMAKADLVFTGGNSLYEAKKKQHTNIYPFPSGIEKEHFIKARRRLPEPLDQSVIKGVKIGFYGVIDERFDIDLIEELADERPEWQFILIGPVVKIEQDSLPKNRNIHYLGHKSYKELPDYLSHWEIAMIPFLLNESTEFISPTKTPEYLSAGVPVVSTMIRDVIHPYGIKKLVHICAGKDDFIQAIETELNKTSKGVWLKRVDQYLSGISWDNSYEAMKTKIIETVNLDKVLIAS
jgi:glycosyltransferase involved in cell wall biosynthesis